MTRDTQTETFIRTLADLRDAEREDHQARLDRQHMAHAEYFRKTFWAEIDDSQRLSDWRQQPTPEPLRTIRQSRAG